VPAATPGGAGAPGPSGSPPGRRTAGAGTSPPAAPPVSREKVAELRYRFKQLPEDEIPVADYAAALQKEILLQGRFYITHRHVCFYSNIFGWQTAVVIPFEDILSIEKTKTLFIQNGIAITTLHGRFSFASFLFRDHTFNRLVTFWRNSQLERPYSVAELLAHEEIHFAVDSVSVFEDDFTDNLAEWAVKPAPPHTSAPAAVPSAPATSGAMATSALATSATSLAAPATPTAGSASGSLAATAATSTSGTLGAQSPVTPRATPAPAAAAATPTPAAGAPAPSATPGKVASPSPAARAPSTAQGSDAAAPAAGGGADDALAAPVPVRAGSAVPTTAEPIDPLPNADTAEPAALGYEPLKAPILDTTLPAAFHELGAMLFSDSHSFLASLLTSLKYTGALTAGVAGKRCGARVD